MAKKSSKASTPSWRTLLRQAKKAESAGNQKQATKLRSRAAIARRSERKNAELHKAMAEAAGISKRKQRAAEALMAAEHRPEENQIIRDHAVTGHTMRRVLLGTATDDERDAVRQSLGRVQGPDGELPERDAEGRPEPGVLVGGKDEQDAQRIIAMIERREGGSAVAEELNKLYRTAKYQGEKAADERYTEQLKRIHEANAIKVVCALLAELEEAARSNGGPLPTIIHVAGYTMARVIDALHRAGYSSKGKQ